MVLKFVRIAVYSTATVVLGTALLIRFCPGAVILVAPGVTIRSPYCSRWQAFRDAPVKLGREVAAARIQMQCRMSKRDGGLELWSTPHGEYWAPSGRDMALGDMLAQEESDIYRFQEMVRPGDVVIDCGAWIGTTVRQALKRGARKVVAVEPTPETVECLRRTFAAEIASGRVIVCPKGIWDVEMVLTLYENGNSGAANSFNGYRDNSTGVSIPVTTIDRLV
ncbi:MAG: FkbM family methyltransferase, partial [Bryobacteraceae bacterium]